MIVVAFAALALSAPWQSAPAAAPTPVPAPAPAATPSLSSAPPAPTAAPEQICRSQRISGSRRSERICHTQAEWDLIRENARNNRDTASRNQREEGGN